MVQGVTVWFGRFEDEGGVVDYLAPLFDEEGRVTSWFAEDLGAPVDPELLEWSFREEPTADPRTLLQGHTFADAFVDAAEAAWAGLEEPCNAVILLFGAPVEAPRSVDGDDYALHFVGRFGQGA